jgi:foldase protein PrsA
VPVRPPRGGKLPGVVKGRGQKSLDAAVFSAKKGVLTGPVKTPFGYYTFDVQTITPGIQQTLEQSERSIRSQLTATRRQSALSRFTDEFKKRWTAKTDCRTGYVVADCKSYRAPSSTTSATGTATLSRRARASTTAR